MRIIVTGSRDWEGSWARNEVNGALALLRALTVFLGEPMVLVHGACPTGVDFLVDEWAKTHPTVTVERHPADWRKYGRAAGPRRNQEMVALGAHMCIGFRKGGSTGTGHTLALARHAGIPTFELLWKEERK